MPALQSIRVFSLVDSKYRKRTQGILEDIYTDKKIYSHVELMVFRREITFLMRRTIRQFISEGSYVVLSFTMLLYQTIIVMRILSLNTHQNRDRRLIIPKRKMFGEKSPEICFPENFVDYFSNQQERSISHLVDTKSKNYIGNFFDDIYCYILFHLGFMNLSLQSRFLEI